MTARLFLDAMVLAYAFGEPSQQQAACREIIAAAAAGRAELHISAETVQEFAFHRLRRTDRSEAVEQARQVVETCELHPMDRGIVVGMLELIASTEIRGRDAVHAATALAAGFDRIVSTDAAFDGVPGLRRIEPREALAP